ncbi:cupredoxin domain-containing protein [Gracilimonas tropica]|uniref:cupredoxin domain-containing protein n=1 Tax=Gracilimonas tropica TaxID=454600 RepID=UPI00035E7366|nr:plastocyanin/azurin family copper-binding protein [Gracilimonas tropica]
MRSGWYISFFIVLLTMVTASATPSDTLEVLVKGTGSDARFEPVILQINAGDVIKFKVMEGVHTVTAYHPANRRPLRIPEKADSFDSGMLTAGDTWFLKLDQVGVYDYFCLPHERMGHAGRILAGTHRRAPNYEDNLLPKAVSNVLNKAYQQFINHN